MQNDSIIKKIIQDMFKVDQGLRMYPDPNNILPMDESGLTLSSYSIYMIDTCNNYRIHKLIKDFGYPTTKIVDRDTLSNFWLLIQHQDYDIELQNRCLQNCDFTPREIALLTDRICINRGQPQQYGTQFHFVDGDRKLYDIQEPDNLSVRRQSLGLSDDEVFT
ncbi:hypothetical protein KKG46_04275 [Patescibacteria group bacterium]|nr:hypothetical protein [Patescibacteria group bacterium]